MVFLFFLIAQKLRHVFHRAHHADSVLREQDRTLCLYQFRQPFCTAERKILCTLACFGKFCLLLVAQRAILPLLQSLIDLLYPFIHNFSPYMTLTAIPFSQKIAVSIFGSRFSSKSGSYAFPINAYLLPAILL